jgi:hypothetical protein
MGIISLQIKVWFIHILQKLRILPKVWYESELKLAGIKAKKTMKNLNI